MEASLSGGPSQPLAWGQVWPGTIVISSTDVFWAEPGEQGVGIASGALLSVPIGGATLTTIANDQTDPFGLAGVGNDVYWVAGEHSGDARRVLRAAIRELGRCAVAGDDVLTCQHGRVVGLPRGSKPAPVGYTASPRLRGRWVYGHNSTRLMAPVVV